MKILNKYYHYTMQRINNQIDKWTAGFKDDLKNLILTKSDDLELIDFVLTYPTLVLTNNDICKRKRSKIEIPLNLRCIAKVANHGQCTRRKKEGSEFCGTHIKGTPHGVSNTNSVSENTKEVFTIEIDGIVHWADKEGNVYKTTDVLSNKKPAVIGRYEKNQEGIYKLLQN